MYGKLQRLVRGGLIMGFEIFGFGHSKPELWLVPKTSAYMKNLDVYLYNWSGIWSAKRINPRSGDFSMIYRVSHGTSYSCFQY